MDSSADPRSAVQDWTRRLLRFGLAVAGGFLFWLLLGETAYADTGAGPDQPSAETSQASESQGADAQGSADARAGAEKAAAAERDAERAASDAERAAADAVADAERAAADAVRDGTAAADEARRALNRDELQPVGGALDRALRDFEDAVGPMVPAPGSPLLPDSDTVPGPRTPEALTGDLPGWLADAISSPTVRTAVAVALGTLASTVPALPPAPGYPLWPVSGLAVATASSSFSGPGQVGALLLSGLLLPALVAMAYWRRFVDRCQFRSVRPAVSPD